jgi:hypothetical protein
MNDILLQVWAAQTCGINPSEYEFYTELVDPSQNKFRVSIGSVSTEAQFSIREVLHALDVDFMENKGAAFVISDEAPEYAPSFLSAQDWDDEDNQAAVAVMVQAMVDNQLGRALDKLAGLNTHDIFVDVDSALPDIKFIYEAAMLLKQYQR